MLHDIWYNRALRLWVVMTYDEATSMEVGDCKYCLTKQEAFEVAGLPKMNPKQEQAYRDRVKAMFDRFLTTADAEQNHYGK